MSQPLSSTEGGILRALGHGKTMTIEEVMASLPELRWSEILLAVDALSRRGLIRLRRRRFNYEVELVALPRLPERPMAS